MSGDHSLPHLSPDVSRGVGPLQVLGHTENRRTGPWGEDLLEDTTAPNVQGAVWRRGQRRLSEGRGGARGHLGAVCRTPRAADAKALWSGACWARAEAAGDPEGSGQRDGTGAMREKGLGLDSTASPGGRGTSGGQPHPAHSGASNCPPWAAPGPRGWLCLVGDGPGGLSEPLLPCLSRGPMGCLPAAPQCAHPRGALARAEAGGEGPRAHPLAPGSPHPPAFPGPPSGAA